MKYSTKKIIHISLLIAITIILERIFVIETPIVRLSMRFLPIAISAIMYGPLVGGVTAALADIMGMMLFPKGVLFFGFTITAFITGMIFGLFLYKKEITFRNITLSALFIAIIPNLILNSIWIAILTGKAFSVIMYPRIFKSVVMIPIQIISIYYLWKSFERHIDFK